MATIPPTPVADDDAHRGTAVVIGIGVALLSAAIVLSTAFSRADGTLDWSDYGVGLLATGALLAIAGLGRLGYTDRALGVALTAWPSAFGALGAGLMAVVAMDADDASPWVAGLLITAIGAVALTATQLPLTVGVLSVEHPSHVAAAAAIAGAAAFAVALVRARSVDARTGPSSPSPPAEPVV